MKALRLLSAALACSLLLAISPPQTPIYGYAPANSDRERNNEQSFLESVSAQAALDDATVIGAKPHAAGTASDYQLALAMREMLRRFGFIARIETLTARVDSPKKLSLALLPSGVAALSLTGVPLADRSRVRARNAQLTPNGPPLPAVGLDLHESPLPEDPATADSGVAMPFIAGSPDGNVTGPIVYASHGLDADYGVLAAHNIALRGAVAIVRYGAQFPGILARRAAEHGAAAVLFYNDPADQRGRGPAYPNGPYRPLTAVQRATVGEGVTIPALPISGAVARQLIATIRGPTVPPPWSGGLATNYPIGRGPAAAHVVVELYRKNVTLWNTIGVMPGIDDSQRVLLGADRSAWVYGVGESGSGLISILEAARGMGILAAGGWQPGRTIVIAGWDGEELGDYGSIAFVRSHADEMRGTIAYLDAEQNVTGRDFGTDAAAPIRDVVAEATQIVPDPARPGTSVYDTWSVLHHAMPPIELVGTTEDHGSSVFSIGTPSLNAGFTGPFGVYQSSYDTLRYATTYSDPDFVLHRTNAQLYGVIAMRLADADMLPYRFNAYVAPLHNAVRLIDALARADRLTLDDRNLNAAINHFAAAATRYDRATVRLLTANDADRALEAARLLNLTAYGSDGHNDVLIPEIARAVPQGQTAVDIATARVLTTLERATALIAL